MGVTRLNQDIHAYQHSRILRDYQAPCSGITHSRIVSQISRNLTISPFYPSVAHAILFHRTHGCKKMQKNRPAMLFIARRENFSFLNEISKCDFKHVE